MTVDKDLKKLVRDRAERTGQTYAAARRSLLKNPPEGPSGSVTRLWFARASQGYRGKGAKPTGFERYEITATNQELSVRAEVVFSNYGLHNYDVLSDGSTKRSTYEYGAGQIVVTAALERGAWRAVIDADGDRTEVEVTPAPADPVPSVAARFLPLVHADDAFEYVPVPEDAFPAWRPSGGGSWFPVMGVSRAVVDVRVVARRGSEPVASVKGAPKALAYDHVDSAGVIRATTWLNESGEVVAYEQPGCVLRAVSEDEALALDPRNAAT